MGGVGKGVCWVGGVEWHNGKGIGAEEGVKLQGGVEDQEKVEVAWSNRNV